MLTIYVDNQAVPTPSTPCTTLADLIAEVTRELQRDGRIVQKLMINGQNYFTLRREFLNYVMTDPGEFRQVQKVEICSAAADTLAHDTIAGAIAYSEALLLGLQSIAQKLRAGQIQEGFHFYKAALDGILSLTELMSSLQSVLHVDYTQEVVNGVSLQHSLDDLTPKIQSLVEAQERNDLIALADLLEYDIYDIIGRWKLALHAFTRLLAAEKENQNPESRRSALEAGFRPVGAGFDTPAIIPTRTL
ncbi:MAG: hypothetical protein HYR55_19905 [Acidobacteria bacterium]|nr:hypothetical protein [Acidobacteriota bacterium]MBI3657195.1 hypothetical protein [Acidobacteriota bacterium]